jgi:hypothetical protein
MEFDWGLHHRLEDRLSELADYIANQGHCNVPFNYSENTWVLGRETKSHYRLHHEGKKSQITPARIQKLIWALSGSVHSHRKGMPKKPNLDDDATRLARRVVELQSIPTAQSQDDFSSTGIRSNQFNVAFKAENPFGLAKSTSTSSRFEPQVLHAWKPEMHHLTKRILMARLRN